MEERIVIIVCCSVIRIENPVVLLPTDYNLSLYNANFDG
jgi:hypothetical protein